MTHQVVLEPGNDGFQVDAGETILDAALRQGLPLPYGCRGGSCGACRAKLLAGEVSYAEPPQALSDGEREAGQVLLCQARPGSDLRLQIDTSAIEGLSVKTSPCRVVDLHKLAPDVMRLYLKLPPNEKLLYRAGQYLDVILRNGRERSFSIANPPHVDDHLELHVRHVFGGEFSGFVFNGMKEKTILRMRGPLGGFYLRYGSRRPIIMMAGGTGFAPLKAMLEDAFYQGLTRPVHLYWGARARRDLYQNDLPETWSEQYPGFRYTAVLSEPASDDDWQGRRGFVHAAVAADYPDLSQHQVYMSGPPVMIDVAKEAFFAQGLSADELFYDSFDYAFTGSA